MNETVAVMIITAAGSVLVATMTFYLTKRHEFAVQLRNGKLNHYKVLFSAPSDLAVDGTDKIEANKKFALAARQYVITALMAFHDEVKFSNPNKDPNRHDILLMNMLLAVRKGIGLARGDEPDSFNFHLIGTAPKK